jgi:hypothetical protein
MANLITRELNPVELEYQRMSAEIDAELAKGDRGDISRLNSLCRRIVAFGDRNSVRLDHNHVYDRAKLIMDLVNDIQKTYGNKFGSFIGYSAVAVSFVAAAMGVSPLISEIPEHISKVGAVASQAMSGFGNALSSFGSFSDKSKEADRTRLSHSKEVYTQSQTNRNQAMGQTQSQAREAINSENQANEALHRANSAATAA